MKKGFKKALGLVIAAAALAVLGYGGWYLYENVILPTQAPTIADPLTGEKVKELKELTSLPLPKVEADVYDNIAYAEALNHDVVGWLQIPSTDINNLILQGDDNDFYLRRNENKSPDIYGCYFLDYECGLGKADDFSQNTVIYGHSDSTDNKDGKRFAQLYRYLDDEFAKENPYIFVTTADGKFVFEIFSVFYVDTTKMNYIKVNITEEEKLELAKSAKELSIRDYKIEPQLSDKLITLSTCTVKYEDTYRFVVMGKMLTGEAADSIKSSGLGN